MSGKTAAVVPKQGRWRVWHVGLARGGWSAVLVDLAQVDADLVKWL
ncbi:MAG: hypothetical protein KDE51_10180 [Anaerolineales bacterium]|nr:hypothetical protein [Anaerolineales bacterium]